MSSRRAEAKTNVLRVGVGTPDEPFGSPWRFWTHRTSAYFSQRSAGGILKASYHPADSRHRTAVWTYGFTTESGNVFPEFGGRRSNTWNQPAEIMPGWFRTAIGTPKLHGRTYNFPHILGDVADVTWVPTPSPGNTRFLLTYLSDGRSDLPGFPLSRGTEGVGWIRMSNGWHLSVLTAEEPIAIHSRYNLDRLSDEMKIGISGGPVASGSQSAAMIWVTTSPDGRPLFVQLVADSESFFEESETPSE